MCDKDIIVRNTRQNTRQIKSICGTAEEIKQVLTEYQIKQQDIQTILYIGDNKQDLEMYNIFYWKEC